MKFTSPSLKIAAFAAALSGSILFATANDGADDSVQGGEIEGTESIHQKIALVATVDAPAGAAGKAKLEAENEHGTATAKLELEVAGLVAGSYDVSVTKKSDGSVVDLGSFDFVGVTSADPGDDDSDLVKPTAPRTSSKNGGGDSDENENEDVTFGGENGIALPADLNPLDLATISIADTSAVVLLTGDLSAANGMLGSKIVANVALTAGAGAPDVTGAASLTSKFSGGKLTKRFRLNAKKLPADTEFAVSVNGTDVTTMKSSHKGKLSISKLKGVDAFSIHTVTLSSGGTVAATANF